jgi:DNA-directed RNA polymerase specialized sigma24 family protein
MSKAIKTENLLRSDGRDEVTLLRKMTRLLEILVRMDLQVMKANKSQKEMIALLDSVGCGQSEIADLLGTTTNTVNVSLYKAKRKGRAT